MNLSVTSVASFLPSSSTEYDGAAFLGTTALAVSPTTSPLEEARKRADQAAKQLDDAETRNIAWSTEDDIILTDEDAEGDEDTEYFKGPNGDYVRTDVSLIGIRNAEGEIEPIPPNHNVDEAHFDGITEEVPTRLDLFVCPFFPPLMLDDYKDSLRQATKALAIMKRRNLWIHIQAKVCNIRFSLSFAYPIQQAKKPSLT